MERHTFFTVACMRAIPMICSSHTTAQSLLPFPRAECIACPCKSSRFLNNSYTGKRFHLLGLSFVDFPNWWLLKSHFCHNGYIFWICCLCCLLSGHLGSLYLCPYCPHALQTHLYCCLNSTKTSLSFLE